jgi:hypothetical protein
VKYGLIRLWLLLCGIARAGRGREVLHGPAVAAINVVEKYFPKTEYIRNEI